MRGKNNGKSRMNLMKVRPFATGVHLTKLAKIVVGLSALKLLALGLLWLPEKADESLLLQPVIIRSAVAAPVANATDGKAANDTTNNASGAGPVNASSPAPGSPANATDPGADPSDPRQAANARQQALDKREAELRTLESELDQKLETLHKLEVKVQGMIDAANGMQDEKMTRLIEVYSNMKPKQAAQVLESLEEPIAVKILAGMSGRKAGEVLSLISTERAAQLSAALTRMQTAKP